MRRFILGLATSLFVSGCQFGQNVQIPTTDPIDVFEEQIQGLEATFTLENELRNIIQTDSVSTQTYIYPMQNYSTSKTKKIFGQYIDPNAGDRFSGYHTGDDIEVTDISVEVPFFALTDATVVRKDTISGYGGVLILEFVDDDAVTYQALYGHVDLSSISAKVGDAVSAGQRLGMLGDDQSAETDGERKHLHFGIYPATGLVLYAGYTATDADLQQWVNPSDFLRTVGAIEPTDIIPT